MKSEKWQNNKKWKFKNLRYKKMENKRMRK